MLRPRIIPCLLLHEEGLVKTVEFKSPKYVGDPINAVRIFNEKIVDELVVLDIDATVNGVEPNYRIIASLASECRMPLCYGGGVRTPEQAKRIIGLGVEKIAVSAAVFDDLSLVTRIAESVGQQSVVVVLDVRKKAGLFSTGYEVRTRNGKQVQVGDPFDLARKMQEAGAGEIVINSIDRDGKMNGYDLKLASKMHQVLSVPLSILGGAGSHQHIQDLFAECGVIGACAGSLFVFKGSYRAVLINYPNPTQKATICSVASSSILSTKPQNV